MSDIIKTQRSLATKAKYQKEHQFDHLYRLICRRDWIKDALDTILSNKGSKTAGIDGMTKKALESDAAKAKFVKELKAEIRSKQFRPMPVRRIKHMGNCALICYADDWLLLTNGGKEEAIRLKEEFKTFLWSELKLELSPEKTRITHVNQGFNFLGFHVQRYVKSNDRPKMLVKPAQENIKKLKLRIKEMTRRKWFQDSPLLKISALNAVLRGWINYYRHTNLQTTLT